MRFDWEGASVVVGEEVRCGGGYESDGRGRRGDGGWEGALSSVSVSVASWKVGWRDV